MHSFTGDPGSEGAARDVVLVEADYDAVVAGRSGQVGHGAGAVLVILATDLRLRRPLHGQGQPPCSKPSPHTSHHLTTGTVPLKLAPPAHPDNQNNQPTN